MDMRKLVGQNFARLRREKGLTQEQVEERSGFSQQYLSGLERGQRNPTIVTLYELAQVLGVSHMELLRPDDAEGPSPSASEHVNRSV
ncbi:helix-turn-helix domain-containing protein [Mesorhizobium sp. CA10]|uniref:helix-turn-helix domain-containing protein n=1 Tax=Mesorhizobium sp. CA10 TaxID=588495 RepID=UPI001CCE8801|nr:helix-turn-helix transcriptional regulator [Mesorhizobium sp. CA10]MBZ9884819.1 helix-turn-helix domain-containing protein [Mesorhizobium sp. CA10]